jgi:hypothetical protein
VLLGDFLLFEGAKNYGLRMIYLLREVFSARWFENLDTYSGVVIRRKYFRDGVDLSSSFDAVHDAFRYAFVVDFGGILWRETDYLFAVAPGLG